MTTTPYSDAWVKHTVERMAALGIGDGDVERATGIDPGGVLDDDGPVTLEVAGPIDEHLANLEEHVDAASLRRAPKRPSRSLRVVDRTPRAGDLVPVAVDLQALTGLRHGAIQLHPDARRKP